MIPLVKSKTLHSNYSELIQGWGKPSHSELKQQVFGADLSGQPAHCNGRIRDASYQRQLPPGVEKLPVLNSRLISIVLKDVTERSVKEDSYTLIKAKSLTRVNFTEDTGQLHHCCTVSQGRLGFLREQNSDCLHRLKEWVMQTERAETGNACLSAQAGHRLQEASGANLLIGDSPLTASIAFASSWSNTLDRHGWTTPLTNPLPLINMLNMTEKTQSETLDWLGRQQPAKWWVITRKRMKQRQRSKPSRRGVSAQARDAMRLRVRREPSRLVLLLIKDQPRLRRRLVVTSIQRVYLRPHPMLSPFQQQRS